MIEHERDATVAALTAMEQTGDPRLREILVSLVDHLHGWVRDVELTEDEFRTATAIVNEIGQLSVDGHNEAVLMAGSLGVSTLVTLLGNGSGGPTSQSTLGPFWRLGAPVEENGASIVRSPTPGPEMFAELRIVDREGRPVEGARVDVWHSSPVGLYENQDEGQADMNLRGTFRTDSDGRVWFRSVLPAGYPIPTHGVVGRLLAAQGRHPNRPAHLHALVEATGFRVLTSQIYVPDDPNLDSDPQFGVTANLIGDYVRHDEPRAADGRDVRPPWYSLQHTLVLEPGATRLPRPPIP
jgi:catechol 1,2-dioxygenase